MPCPRAVFGTRPSPQGGWRARRNPTDSCEVVSKEIEARASSASHGLIKGVASETPLCSEQQCEGEKARAEETHAPIDCRVAVVGKASCTKRATIRILCTGHANTLGRHRRSGSESCRRRLAGSAPASGTRGSLGDSPLLASQDCGQALLDENSSRFELM